MAGKKIEQFKFTRGEIDVLTVKTHGARQRIDSQTMRLNNAVRLRLAHRLLSAEQRLNAGNQLLHRERFCQIIIRPGFQAGNTVSFTAAGANDDNGQVAGHLADTAANLQTINIRQHQIEDHRVPRLFFQKR